MRRLVRADTSSAQQCTPLGTSSTKQAAVDFLVRAPETVWSPYYGRHCLPMHSESNVEL